MEREVIFIAILLLAVAVGAFVKARLEQRMGVKRKCKGGCAYFERIAHGKQRCRMCGWVRCIGAKKHIVWLLMVISLCGCSKRIKPELPVLPGVPVFAVPEGPMWSDPGYQLILDYEVGGGKPYYDKFLSHPTWPGFVSGVTVGVGYDCGYSAADVIQLDWHQLPFVERDRLAATSGVTGRQAKSLIPSVEDILIAWPHAQEVFQRVTVGRYWQMTRRAFPGVEALCPEAQWVCLSTVFNRGSGMTGSRRKEMRDMRDAVERQDYVALAKAERASVRVWAGTDIERGMQRRRFAEATLIEQCR